MDFDMKDFEELNQDINLTRDQLEDLNKLRKNVRELQRIRDEATKDIAEIYSHLLDEGLYTGEVLTEIQCFFQNLGKSSLAENDSNVEDKLDGKQ